MQLTLSIYISFHQAKKRKSNVSMALTPSWTSWAETVTTSVNTGLSSLIKAVSTLNVHVGKFSFRKTVMKTVKRALFRGLAASYASIYSWKIEIQVQWRSIMFLKVHCLPIYNFTKTEAMESTTFSRKCQKPSQPSFLFNDVTNVRINRDLGLTMPLGIHTFLLWP